MQEVRRVDGAFDNVSADDDRFAQDFVWNWNSSRHAEIVFDPGPKGISSTTLFEIIANPAPHSDDVRAVKPACEVLGK